MSDELYYRDGMWLNFIGGHINTIHLFEHIVPKSSRLYDHSRFRPLMKRNYTANLKRANSNFNEKKDKPKINTITRTINKENTKRIIIKDDNLLSMHPARSIQSDTNCHLNTSNSQVSAINLERK